LWLRGSLLLQILLLLAVGNLALADPQVGQLDDLKWIDPGADPVAELTRVRPECTRPPSGAAAASLVALGRIAFRSPVLLGGIAARSGMSCNTCHRNGHDNPAFFLAGVSGNPGTADVTGALFSRGRDDGSFNPVPIPTLVDAASDPPFGSVLPMDDLRDFHLAIVVEEFQGQLPPDAVLEGLHAYVDALRSGACPAPASEEVTLEGDSLDLEAAYDVMLWAIERADIPTAEFVSLAWKAALGRMHQRFAPDGRSQGLVKVSRALTPVRALLETDPGEAATALARVRDLQRGVLSALGAEASRSFYDPGFLEKALRSAN
jgi:hypothetical protein